MQFHGLGSKIMIVEKDRTILEMLEVRLDVAGYHPIGVRSGLQAISILRNTQIDALMIELELPDINGIEVLKTANGQIDRAPTPALLMGRDLSAETVKRAAQFGVRACLAKPFSGADALDRLIRVLKAPRPMRVVVLDA
jgi:DNA-binding response OmpR family regulator